MKIFTKEYFILKIIFSIFLMKYLCYIYLGKFICIKFWIMCLFMFFAHNIIWIRYRDVHLQWKQKNIYNYSPLSYNKSNKTGKILYFHKDKIHVVGIKTQTNTKFSPIGRAFAIYKQVSYILSQFCFMNYTCFKHY